MATRETKYTDYIKNKYPDYEIIRERCNFTDGKHADILIINENDVFKFSRYDWSIGYIENEATVINCLGRDMSIYIPKAELVEKGIARLTYIKGEPLYRNTLLQLVNRMQDMVAEQLAVFLKQLHSAPLKGERFKNLSESQVCISQENWLEKYQEIERKVFPYCDSYSKEYYRQIFRPLLTDEKFLDFRPALIHGDLMPYHILFNKNSNRISGIIDFGLAGTGDPAYDIGILLDNYGEDFVKRMSRYYKNIEVFMDRARFYAYTSNLMWAKAVADMISTRDFTNFRFQAKDRDIMPIGTK